MSPDPAGTDQKGRREWRSQQSEGEDASMAYVTLSDLGQQDRQQSWWNWFFGIGPKPKKPYKEQAFKQQQAGATFAPGKQWGDMEFEAEAAEDLNPFAATGYDSAQALGRLADVSQWGVGLADDPTPPAPAPVAVVPSGPGVPRGGQVLMGALAIGGAATLIVNHLLSKEKSVERPVARNRPRRRRNG
jgi:hypothetical protein